MLKLEGSARKLAERWRDERRLAHVPLLTSLRQGIEGLELIRDTEKHIDGSAAVLARPAAEVRAHLLAAQNNLSEVELLGSSDASLAARLAVAALRPELTHAEHSSEPDASTRLLLTADGAMRSYLRLARRHLGTSEV